MKYTVKLNRVCPASVSFELHGNIVTNVSYEGGCNGNLKAIGKLVDGMTVERLEEILKGNTCGHNTTSCADQLAIAVREKYEESKDKIERNF